MSTALSKYPPRVQLGILSTAFFCTFILYGICLEGLFREPTLKASGWYITLLQFFAYTIISKVEMVFNGLERKVPFRNYIFLSLATVGTMGFSNVSLQYLNYPTQVVFKSCKLIPVMIGGVIIQKKSYDFIEILSTCMMCCGLCLFILADTEVNIDENKIVFLGLWHLTCTGYWRERIILSQSVFYISKIFIKTNLFSVKLRKL